MRSPGSKKKQSDANLELPVFPGRLVNDVKPWDNVAFVNIEDIINRKQNVRTFYKILYSETMSYLVYQATLENRKFHETFSTVLV